MKRVLMLLAVLAVVTAITAPAMAQKVTIDYARDFDFSAVKTFTYVDTPDSNAGDDLTNDRIRRAIVSRLVSEGKLRQVESGGDILVTYHAATQDRTVFNTTTYGYGGWGAGWGRWGYPAGMGAATTTASTYTDGTLIVDAYEPGEKHLVWRGAGTVTVKDKPEKRAQQIESILDKMGKKWQKILASQGK